MRTASNVVMLAAVAAFFVWSLGRAVDHEFAYAATPHKIGDGSLLRAISHERAQTWRCQRELARPLSPTSYAAERSPSLAFRKWTHRLWRKRARYECSLARQLTNPVTAIYAVFGSRGAEAVAVSRCETGGTFNIYASNGQYKGLFQVSEHWRETVPGFAYTPLAQARHAYRVFRLTGSNWSHWACKP
jgi:hypothetical protein